jgi:hypothetical protein
LGMYAIGWLALRDRFTIGRGAPFVNGCCGGTGEDAPARSSAPSYTDLSFDELNWLLSGGRVRGAELEPKLESDA